MIVRLYIYEWEQLILMLLLSLALSNMLSDQ